MGKREYEPNLLLKYDKCLKLWLSQLSYGKSSQRRGCSNFFKASLKGVFYMETDKKSKGLLKSVMGFDEKPKSIILIEINIEAHP